jgi:hypothetical protein
MAEFTRPKVPTGETKYVTTKQKEITPGQFFVGYETTWKTFQKEVPYSNPRSLKAISRATCGRVASINNTWCLSTRLQILII